MADDTRAIALVRGTIYVDPWDEPIPDGTLVIDGGYIAAVGARNHVHIPNDTRVLDCTGLSLTAGFWNSHVHFTDRKWSDAARIPAATLALQLLDLTRYGFTSVFDLSSALENTKEIRRRIESAEVDGPRILSTGEGIIPAGAAPSDNVLAAMGWMSVSLPDVGGPEQAAAAARRLLDQCPDAVKLFASGAPSAAPRTLTQESMHAVVELAHAAHKPVFVHPNNADDVSRSVNARVDVIAHTVPSADAWQAAFTTASQVGIALTPTLMLWKHALRPAAVEQLAFFRAAAGTVLFGTDYGAVGADPTDEYALMAEAGMTFSDTLASLTTAPSERFGGSQSNGTLSVGAQADIVALESDPSRHPRAFADVCLTLRAGRIVYRRGIPPNT
ncbi:MAG: amidohydrolase family protein [Candidatus Cybelea sp.]